MLVVVFLSLRGVAASEVPATIRASRHKQHGRLRFNISRYCRGLKAWAQSCGKQVIISIKPVLPNLNMNTQTLDLTGLKCPLPILKTKKALAQMQAGEYYCAGHRCRRTR